LTNDGPPDLGLCEWPGNGSEDLRAKSRGLKGRQWSGFLRLGRSKGPGEPWWCLYSSNCRIKTVCSAQLCCKSIC